MSRTASYEAPTIRDLGDLTQITADVHHVTMGVTAAAAVSSPMTPNPPGGGGGGGGTIATAGTPPTPDVSDAAPGNDNGTGFGDVSPGDTSGGSPGTTGTVSVDTTGGRLPFTGLPAALIALLGSLLSAMGLVIRRSLRRDSR